MTVRLIIIGKANTLSDQIARIRVLGLVPNVRTTGGGEHVDNLQPHPKLRGGGHPHGPVADYRRAR